MTEKELITTHIREISREEVIRCVNGQECSLHPPDLGLEIDSWDQAFMESIFYYIEKDLKLFGVTDFHKTGRMD